jgi:hypothetical protein
LRDRDHPNDEVDFPVGTRVRLNARGVALYRFKLQARGTVVGRSHYESCRRVKWDHLSVPQTIPKENLELA